MDLKQIQSFIQLFDKTDINELLWEKNGVKIAFKKGNGENIIFNQKILKRKSKAEEKQQKIKGEKEELFNDDLLKEFPIINREKEYVTIKSRIVGTFHLAPPDKASLVKEGDNIRVGQKIYIIEAMKILKEITSEIKGKIIKILVDDGHAVEYGQSLFLVDTCKTEHQGGKDV